VCLRSFVTNVLSGRPYLSGEEHIGCFVAQLCSDLFSQVLFSYTLPQYRK
jgi:hypothetical protein